MGIHQNKPCSVSLSVFQRQLFLAKGLAVWPWQMRKGQKVTVSESIWHEDAVLAKPLLKPIIHPGGPDLFGVLSRLGIGCCIGAEKGQISGGHGDGPASVVAVEGTRNVWLSHCGKLLRASPEQLRPKSFREWNALKLQSDQGDSSKSQAFPKPLKNSVFIDLDSGEIPDGDESSGYTPSLEPDGELSVDVDGGHEGDEHGMEENGEQFNAWKVPVPASPFESEEENDIPEENIQGDGGGEQEGEDLLFGDDVVFSAETGDDVWEIDISVDSKEESALFSASSSDESMLLVSDAKKRKVEVRLSSPSSNDQLRMAVAKHKEVGAWLKHSTVRRVARGKIPDDDIMRCRWILTWKAASPSDHPDDVRDGKKGKARLVVVGFEDPGVGVVQTDSPTLTKDGRLMVVQQVSSRGWGLVSFDISTAFLDGDGDGRLLGIHPPPELAESLRMKEGDQCELVGGAYGRVDAPYLWFCTFRDTLKAEGFRQSPQDPCVFTLVSEDKKGHQQVHGSLGIHVDDGIGGGDKKVYEAIERIRTKFAFGSFEKGAFNFTEIGFRRFRHWDDKSVEYDQIEYVDKISPIEIKKCRRSQVNSPLNPEEDTQLRSLVGALQHAAVHARPDIAVKVGELQASVPRATVENLILASRLLHEAKSNSVTLMTVPISVDRLSFCAFSDASFLPGKEKFAHQGRLVFATTPELLENKKSEVAPVAWISMKIHRVTRSTLGAEAIALSGAVDRLLWIRLLWEWINNPAIDRGSPEEALQKARKAALVTDCKSASDILTRAAIPHCEEHRTTVECLLNSRKTPIAWYDGWRWMPK